MRVSEIWDNALQYFDETVNCDVYRDFA